MTMVTRRQFAAVFGGAAAWPLAARAENATAVIGMLQIGAPSSWDFTGFRQGLKEAGYVEGQNLQIEYRWANEDPNRLPELAADLVRRQVRVIVAFGSNFPVQAAKAATSAIPIVFGFGSDPVQSGLVASLNRPGGNVTGMTSQSSALVGKQLGLLHELVPQATHIGVLAGRLTSVVQSSFLDDAKAAGPLLGLIIEPLSVTTGAEIDAAFLRLANEKRVQALLVSNDSLFIARRVQLAILAARLAIPAIYPFPEQVDAGGLMSYGPDLVARDREVGHYVGRILNGEKPGDLPVQQQSKFEFVINMRTAAALGLTVSNAMQLLADRVIE